MQRPAAQLVAKLAKFRVELIANGAQFMKDTVPALCADIPLESLKLAIETVFCAPPITDPYVERCNNYYKLARSDKQHKLNERHHLGRPIRNQAGHRE